MRHAAIDFDSNTDPSSPGRGIFSLCRKRQIAYLLLAAVTVALFGKLPDIQAYSTLTRLRSMGEARHHELAHLFEAMHGCVN